MPGVGPDDGARSNYKAHPLCASTGIVLCVHVLRLITFLGPSVIITHRELFQIREKMAMSLVYRFLRVVGFWYVLTDARDFIDQTDII